MSDREDLIHLLVGEAVVQDHAVPSILGLGEGAALDGGVRFHKFGSVVLWQTDQDDHRTHLVHIYEASFLVLF